MTDLIPMMPGYEDYKDSGVEWIGAIPAHWGKVKFKYSMTIKARLGWRGLKAHEYVENSKYGFLSTPNIKYKEINYGRAYFITKERYYESPEIMLKTGDILLVKDGSTLGISNIIKGLPFNCTVNSSIAVLRIFNICLISPIYLELFIKSEVIQRLIAVMRDGMGVPHLFQSDIKNFIHPIPPIEEQTTIANFLDCKTIKIDQAVAIKEKQIHLLKERKRILIQNSVLRGLDPNVPMRDSGVEWIGEIPRHWNIVANRTLFKERVEPGREDLPLLSVSIHSGISDNEISEDENIRGRVKIEDKSKYNLVKPNDIVFNMMRAWQGAIGSVRVNGMVSPAYIIAKPKGLIHSPYFEYQYRCPIFIQQMDRFSKGITDFRKRLYWHEYKQLLTVLPPIEEQKAIIAHIETQSTKIDKAIAIQEQMIHKLKEYKATLINSAVTGKIKVPVSLKDRAVA